MDSSVAVAAILAEHEAHDEAEEALLASAKTIAHVAGETYSVLTRLPPSLRLEGRVAASLLAQRLPSPLVALSAGAHANALERLADAGVSGGATYDGLVALTAQEHDLELVSRDRRAARAYRALGVAHRLLAP